MLNCSNEICDLKSVVSNPIQSTTRVCVFIFFESYEDAFGLLCCIFLYRSFLSQILTSHRIVGEGRGRYLFPSTASVHLRTFRHLLATLHVIWLSRNFNRTACNYQAAPRWDLPTYWITVWLIDDVMLTFLFV